MHRNLEVFSDIFARHDDACSRLDPRLKLVPALITVGCVVLSKCTLFPLAVFTLCLSATLVLRIPAALLAVRLASPLGIVGTLIILQSALTGGTELWSFDLPGLRVLFTREGLIQGALTGVRVIAAVSTILLLSFVTPAHQIFRSLHWLRVPRGWVEIAILMYRYLFTLLDLVGDATAAQTVRLGYVGLRQSLRSMGIVAGTIVVRSVDQAARTHSAMVLRGYDGVLPFGPIPSLACRDRWSLAAAVVLIIGLFFLCERRFA